METHNHNNNHTAADDPSPSSDRRRRRRRRPQNDNSSSNNDNNSNGNEYSNLSEAELIAAIEKRENSIKMVAHNLKDNGAKLKSQLAQFQQELERRRNNNDSSQCEKPTGSGSSNGILHVPEQAEPSSQPAEQSAFAMRFLENIKENGKPKSESNTTDDLVGKTIDGGIACESQSHNRKRKPIGQFLPARRAKPELLPDRFSAWKPLRPCGEIQKYRSVNGLSGKDPSFCDLPLSKERKEDSLTEIDDASQTVDPKASSIDETVVLVDEEEPEPREQIQEVEQLPSSSTKEQKIYYPSREDPESLEIFRSELNCLEPGEYLTSTIMNFYIRFLQESPTDSFQNDIYFFNTYFYSKLQEAVSFKKSEQEAFFTKFRRWWKGVNIFKKAYIFLPINEDNHWSLVIICFPDKEDESGPIILHLDSLQLHSSRSIFNNIKTLLKSEWVYLSEDNGISDIPIPERIWKQLPRRIDEKIVMVPRQTNDSDCGLFVLYYMERFIKDAPKRLKRRDLTMFCKNWFKPQEASSLRGKIKKILRQKFVKEPAEDNSIWQPVCLSTNAEAAKAVRDVHNS